MSKHETLSVSPIASLAELMPRAELVAFGVCPDASVVLVGALKPLDYRGGKGGVFAKAVPKAPQSYRIVQFAESSVALDITIDEAPFNVHKAQIVGSEVLLVCARSFVDRTTKREASGYCYTRDGQLIRTITLADGIEDVQATASGVIWTSFFDEGVYSGNPVSAPGLVSWDKGGNVLYSFTPPSELDTIDDCYALNVVSDNEVWFYYYSAFPMVCLRHNVVASHWNMPLGGSAAFAVSYPYALFQGGYNDRDSYCLFKLEADGAVALLLKVKLRSSSGENIKAQRTAGRGDTLYILADGLLYRLTIWDVLAVAG